ncbi:MAG: hypothetical protein QNJ40_05440 [Xanthomonadales bacterium]|nr:hypothetical protein [Xanthomonadales bacterium]
MPATKSFSARAVALTLLLAGLPGAALAQEETFEVFRVIEDLTVTGTVTTDGTLGTLNANNFLRWDLNIGGTPVTEMDSILVILGVRGPIATDQEILIDMSAVPGGNELFAICANNVCNLNNAEWEVVPSGSLTDVQSGLPLPCSTDMMCGGLENIDNVDPARRQVLYTSPQLLPIASKSLFRDGFEATPPDR